MRRYYAWGEPKIRKRQTPRQSSDRYSMNTEKAASSNPTSNQLSSALRVTTFSTIPGIHRILLNNSDDLDSVVVFVIARQPATLAYNVVPSTSRAIAFRFVGFAPGHAIQVDGIRGHTPTSRVPSPSDGREDVGEILADAALQDRHATADDASVYFQGAPDGAHCSVPGGVFRSGSYVDGLQA
jgi:hypothetical protein